MDSAGHIPTPGPWEAIGRAAWVEGNDGRMRLIATVPGDGDLRLVVAAPRLAELLSRAYGEVSDGQLREDIMDALEYVDGTEAEMATQDWSIRYVDDCHRRWTEQFQDAGLTPEQATTSVADLMERLGKEFRIRAAILRERGSK